MKKTGIYLSIIITVILSFCINAHAKEIFKDDFEKGLGEWEIFERGGTVKVVPGLHGKCVEIERTNEHDFTYISIKFKDITGNLKFTSLIKAENVLQGTKNYYRGKFQALIIENKIECCYTEDKILGSSGWSPKKVEIRGIKKGQIVELRIGLQNAKGKIWVDDVQVTQKPEKK